MKTTIQTILVLLVFTVLCGGVYPLSIWVAAQIIWPFEANGSLIQNQAGLVIGSELIAQKFEGDKYFFVRPSASDFATVPSSASNLGPTSTVLKDIIAKRRDSLALKHNTSPDLVPDELVTSSGSGLDPDLSVAAVQFQVNRVVRARAFSTEKANRLAQAIVQLTRKAEWGLFGDPRINVLQLNLALDKLAI